MERSLLRKVEWFFRFWKRVRNSLTDRFDADFAFSHHGLLTPGTDVKHPDEILSWLVWRRHCRFSWHLRDVHSGAHALGYFVRSFDWYNTDHVVLAELLCRIKLPRNLELLRWCESGFRADEPDFERAFRDDARVRDCHRRRILEHRELWCIWVARAHPDGQHAVDARERKCMPCAFNFPVFRLVSGILLAGTWSLPGDFGEEYEARARENWLERLVLEIDGV